MEQQIPTSLANAPRDALGRPVPYIILWESEEPYLDTDPALSKFGWPGLAVCRTTRVGDGAPLFKSLNESRQRHAALHWLCVMCGRPATPDGNVSPASPLWAVRLVGPDERPLSHASPASQGPLARLRDSWACIGCLHYALRACPALVGLRHEPGSRVQVLRITAASIELGIKRPESDESDERDESRPVCSIAHIAVWEAEEFRSETFVAWLDHTLSEGDRTVNLEEVDDGQLWTVSPDLQVGWDHGHLTVQGTSGETRVLSSEFVPLLELFSEPIPMSEGVRGFLARFADIGTMPDGVAETLAFAHQLCASGILVAQPRLAAEAPAREIVTKIEQVHELTAGLGGGTTPARGEELYELIKQSRPERCLELGFAHGVSTAYIAAALEANGSGHLTSVDRPIAASFVPTAQELISKGRLDHRVRLVYEETGYVWYLRTLIQEQMKESGAVEPCLDFAFLDGAGTWHVDALAFLLLDRLLRPGAWLVFDDIDWTWAHVGDDQLAEVEQLYGDLGPVWQRDIKQLSDVWELLLVPSGRYDETRRDGQRAFARRI